MKKPVNFCQVCSHAMTDRVVYGKLRRVCPACGFVYFDDPKVAAVTFIEDRERVLLVRRAMNPERGKWALPAGYIDHGEDPREAAIREVREETGLEVAITHLIDVQGGPVSLGASIVIIFGAHVVDGHATPRDDADAILWYGVGDPLPDLAFESTRTMLNDWLQKHQRHTS